MADDDAWRRADPRLELAVRETWKSLDFQRDHLGELRARLAGALALSTATFGLLGRAVLTEENHLRGWGVPPAIGIVLLFVAMFYVAFPRSWSWIRNPGALADMWKMNHTFDEMLSGLYSDGVRDYDANAAKLQCMEMVTVAGMFVFGLTLGALALALISAR